MCGHSNILKRLLIHAGAFNLGRLLRHLVGIGTPRSLQGRSGRVLRLLLGLYRLLRPTLLTCTRLRVYTGSSRLLLRERLAAPVMQPFATDC